MACKHGKTAEQLEAMSPEERARYESALAHAEWARKQGQSSEEIHAMFKRVMEAPEGAKCGHGKNK